SFRFPSVPDPARPCRPTPPEWPSLESALLPRPPARLPLAATPAQATTLRTSSNPFSVVRPGFFTSGSIARGAAFPFHWPPIAFVTLLRQPCFVHQIRKFV